MLLQPDVLAELSGVLVRARAVADGVFAGLHKSIHRGASRDFSDHKEYAPGDDIRRLDWKAYARFDRPLIRRYESETERGCLILLDVSSSMDFGTGALSKFGYAQTLSAALAFVLLRQQDRVGLGFLADRFDLQVPVRGRGDQLAALVSSLEQVRPSGGADLATALAAAAEAAPKRSLIVVISDFLDTGPGVPGALRVLSTGNREVAALQVLTPEEREFPYDGFRQFISPEWPDERLVLDADAVRRGYLDALGELRAGLREAARETRLTYLETSTEAPPAQILLDWLAQRERTRRRVH